MTKIQVKCLICKKELWRSPSKVEPRNYCSRKCYAETRSQELVKSGKPYRITPQIAKKLKKKRIKALIEKTKGSKHYAWKGESVGYHGLHLWLRREKGNPTKCSFCGKVSKNKRIIQWANVDGKYRRVLEDYIALCGSCHKLKDLAMKSTRDAQSAIQW